MKKKMKVYFDKVDPKYFIIKNKGLFCPNKLGIYYWKKIRIYLDKVD